MSQARHAFWVTADWPAPRWIRAGTTCCGSGFSLAPYTGLNLAQHVGDKVETVERNRALLHAELQLPSLPLWLQQVHGDHVINSEQWSANVIADACITSQENVVCAVLSADCLPLLICHRESRQVAAIHLGWRGIRAGIMEKVIRQFDTEADAILAWIGPHIRARNYEVGEEVYRACLQAYPDTDHAFTCLHKGKWLASLEALVRHQLEKQGISMIYATDECTYDDHKHFYSYRRQPVTGRMASLIWMETESI